MKEIERIADQLRRAWRGPAWHGPAVLEVLSGVGPALAAARPLPGAHSIWELVFHIAAWEHATARRLAGEEAPVPDAEDWPPVEDTSPGAWALALARLERTHAELEAAVGRLDDADLGRPVAGASYDLGFILHGVVQHDLYHAGQIALLRKAGS